MTLSIPPEYVNVIASTVYDADLPASLFQTYCRIVGLAWRDRHHQHLPPATVAELAVYLHCSARSAWGHLIALRKRGLINWTTAHGIVKIRINTALTESPVSLQTFAAPIDHVVVDQDHSGSIQQQQSSDQSLLQTFAALQTFAVSNDHVVVDPDQDPSVLIQQQSSDQSLLQNFAVNADLDSLQNFAVKTDPDPLQNFAPLQTAAASSNLSALQKFAVDSEAAEAQAVAALPHVTPELIQAWGEYLHGRPQVYNLPGLLLYTLRTTHHLPRAEGRGGLRRKTAPSPGQLELPTAEQAALPDEVQTKLDQLGWNGDAAEIAEVHQSDPQRVQAWLDYALAQTAARSRAGLFRTGLRSQTLPPTARATLSTTTGRYVTDELLFTQPESLTRSPQP